MAGPEDELVKMSKEVAADKMLQRAIKEYCEVKQRRVLVMTKQGLGPIGFHGDERSVTRANGKEKIEPNEIMGDENHEELENNGFNFCTTEQAKIPPLICQIGDKKNGWSSLNVQKYLTLAREERFHCKTRAKGHHGLTTEFGANLLTLPRPPLMTTRM